jgi:hypothetical protein
VVIGCFFNTVVTLPDAMSATPSGLPTWGSADRAWGTRRTVTAADRATIAAYRKSRLKPVYSTNFKDPKQLSDDWSLKSDDNAALKSCRRPENVSVKTGVLKLRTEIATNCNARWSTGSLWSNFRQKYGFIEARIKTADVTGINNAFWMVTDDGFEIDIAEICIRKITSLQNLPLKRQSKFAPSILVMRIRPPLESREIMRASCRKWIEQLRLKLLTHARAELSRGAGKLCSCETMTDCLQNCELALFEKHLDAD